MTKTITIVELINLKEVQQALQQIKACSEASLDAIDKEVALDAVRGYQFYKQCLKEVA